MKTNILKGRNLFLLLPILLCFFSTGEVFAQFYVGRISTYAVTSFTEAYTNVSGSNLGTGDDVVFSTSLPFNFNYDNTLFTAGTTVFIGSNGFVKFGGSNPGSGCCGNMLGSSSFGPGPVIMGYDHVVSGGIYVETSGTAPNRVMSIEWRTTRRYSGTGSTTDWKVRLYETTNYIDFLFKDLNFVLATNTATVGCGLNGTTSPSFITVVAATPTTSTPSSHIRFKTPAPNVQLSLTPKFVTFGSMLTGQSTTVNLTVQHAGTEQSLVLQSAAISGLTPADFIITSGPNPPGPLSPGQTATYTIQFTPQAGGDRSCLFTVVTNGRDSGIQSTTLTGFGIAPRIQTTPNELFKRAKVLVNDTLEQSIVISSIGAANLYFTNYPSGSFVLSGDNPDDYVVSRLPQNPLPPGGTDTLKIKFIPKAEGGRPATLTINSNAENAPSIPVLLKGVGIIPRIVIAPTYVDFDSTQISDTSCKQIYVYNVGSDTLTLKDQYFASNDGDFSFTSLSGTGLRIPGNDSGLINICFTPLQRGTRQARLRIIGKIPLTIEQYPRDTSAVDVEIRGNATPLDKSIIAMKDISDAIVGEDAATTLELTNVGTEPVIVNAPVITGANASEFSVSKVVFPATVTPNNSISMTVTAKPMARGERTANVKFNLTSEGRPYSINADVKATALQASAASNATSLAFEKLLLGETVTKTVELTNTGDINQTFTATLTGSDAYSLDNTAIEVLTGAKGTYTVTFAPMTEGKLAGTITIKGSHIADMTVALNGTGEKKPDVTQSVGKVSEADGFQLEQNAPNPAVGYTNFTFTAPKQSTVRLYLADMSGKLVKEVANSSFSGGKHSVSMDTKELPSGSYVYILESGATRIMRQMVVTK